MIAKQNTSNKTNCTQSMVYLIFVFVLLECDGGRFGVNCSQLCGHCVKKEPCHYLNGTCPNGCDDGYQGNECVDGRHIPKRYCIFYIVENNSNHSPAFNKLKF